MGKKAESLKGRKFGRLTCMSREDIEGPNRSYRAYKCLCECGTEKIINAISLQRGRTRSCGCIVSNYSPVWADPRGAPIKRSMLRTYKHGARRRSLLWELSSVEFERLILSPCRYCGSLGTPRGKSASLVANGIDRVDNFEGYTQTNCVPCCAECNQAKHSMSPSDWRAFCLRIAAHINHWV